MKGIERAFISALFCVYLFVATMQLFSAEAAEPVTNLPPAVARKLELVRLLKAENFAELEQRMAELFRIVDAGGSQRDAAKNDLYAFSRADPEIAGPLARWADAYPKSVAPHLAFGLYAAHVGGTVRGEKYSLYTNRERFKEMRRYYDAASESLHKAVALRPETAIAWARLIDIAKVKSNHAAVASLFDDAAVHVPKSSSVYWAYYDALDPKWGGWIGQQFVLKQRIQVLFPGNPDFAWVDHWDETDKAWVQYRKRNYKAALARFEKLIATWPSASNREGRALSLFVLKRVEEGIAEMKRALAAAPGNKEYYARLAWMQRRMKDKENWRAAEQNYDIAVSLSPYDPETLAERADFLREHRKMAAARKDLNRAMFFGAYDDGVRDSRRRFFLVVDDMEAALREAETMVALVPDNPFNHYAYGSTLFADRDCTARDALKRYVDLCDAQADMCRRPDLNGAEMMLNALVDSCS